MPASGLLSSGSISRTLVSELRCTNRMKHNCRRWRESNLNSTLSPACSLESGSGVRRVLCLLRSGPIFRTLRISENVALSHAPTALHDRVAVRFWNFFIKLKLTLYTGTNETRMSVVSLTSSSWSRRAVIEATPMIDSDRPAAAPRCVASSPRADNVEKECWLKFLTYVKSQFFIQ